MRYEEFLAEINGYAEEDYRNFHKKLLKNEKVRVLGVRVPTLKKLAKKYVASVDELMTFPDEYYEVTFVKLSAVAALEWNDFIRYIDRCVPLIDNWATCDCFSAKCIKTRQAEFLPFLERYISEDKEFYQRYALTSLLSFYVEEAWLDTVFGFVERSNRDYYYVHMAAAWLVAEVLAKYFDRGVRFLLRGSLDKKTHNKAIQKATESYRLTAEEKNYLKSIKV